MLVYLITNLINGKQYVGITTTTFKKRVAVYKSMAKHPPNKPTRIVKALAKYGFENFQFEVIEAGFDSYDKLLESEINWIRILNTYKLGYNASLGGDLVSEETRKKMSKAQKGKVHSEQARAKIAATLKGTKRPKEVVEKLNRTTFKKGHTPWNKNDLRS